MDNTSVNHTVRPKKRFSRYDVVTLKSDGSKRIVLRKDGELKYDETNGFTTTKGDEWFNYNESIIQHLDNSLTTKGYIEL